MTKKVAIQPNNPSQFRTIDEYLLHTYGEKKLKESVRDSNPTFLDVIGYTLDKGGLETVEGHTYELEEIEDMMNDKWDKENE